MLVALFKCFRVTLIFSLASRTWRSFKVLETHVLCIIQCNLKKVIGRNIAWWVWGPMFTIIVYTTVCLYIALFSRPLYSIYIKSIYILKMLQSNFLCINEVIIVGHGWGMLHSKHCYIVVGKIVFIGISLGLGRNVCVI